MEFSANTNSGSGATVNFAVNFDENNNSENGAWEQTALPMKLAERAEVVRQQHAKKLTPLEREALVEQRRQAILDARAEKARKTYERRMKAMERAKEIKERAAREAAEAEVTEETSAVEAM